MLAQSLGNLFWGVIADRRGFRLVFLLALGFWMLAALGLIATTTFPELVAVFTGLGLGLGGFQMSAQSLVLEFGSREQLPLRIAVANAASELVAAFGALAGGLLVLVVGHVPVIVFAVACQAVALAVVAFGVEEPRRRA